MSKDPIVVGTDGSSTAAIAVDKAGELAGALGAPVHVVCVPGAIPAYDWPARITGQQIVAEASERLGSRGLTVQTHLPKDEGDAPRALVDVAESEHAQMIVMGNKGMTGLRRLLGSFPNRVSHHARCDVLIVPTQSRSLAEFAGGAIVVGADDSPGVGSAIKQAIRLARAVEGELHIVSTTQASDSGQSAAAEAADQGVKATTHSVSDHLADALPDVAEKHGAAIIVVSGQGMRADDRERFGNVPDKISHKGTSASVLIVSALEASETGGDLASGVAAGDAG